MGIAAAAAAAADRGVGVEKRRDSAAAYTRQFAGLQLTTAVGRAEAAALPAAVVEGYLVLVLGQESSLLFEGDVFELFLHQYHRHEKILKRTSTFNIIIDLLIDQGRSEVLCSYSLLVLN